MKKLISLLLVAATVFSFVGCGTTSSGGNIYEMINTSKPTTITTQVSYIIENDITLNATYVTRLEGNDSVFEYEYQRLATSADVSEYPGEYIITKSGVTYYKDGLYSYNSGDTWEASAPASQFAEFYGLSITEESISSAKISSDGNTLTGSIKPRNIGEVLGVNVSIAADTVIDITVKTNGTRLTDVEIVYTTPTGAAVTVGTSYSYAANDLFPETEAE